MAIEKLPVPTPGAADKLEFAREIISSIPGVGGVVSEALRQMLVRRLEKGMLILAEEVSSRGIGALEEMDEGQKEYFLPSAYRFAEQVRIGDYEHTLRVVAKVVAGRLASDISHRDEGIALRLCRQLEGLPFDCLIALGRFQDAFKLKEENALGVMAKELIEAYGKHGDKIDKATAYDFLNQLAGRGILVPNSVWGGTAYTAGSIYSDVMRSVQEVVSEMSG